MDKEKIYQLALSFVPGIGSVLSKQLVSYCGSAEAVFNSSKSKLNKIPRIGNVVAQAIHKNKLITEAEEEIEKAAKNNIDILFYTDKKYPQNLKKIYDAPSILYVQGNVDLNNQKIVGIVGTRKATDYGKEVVEKIIKELAIHNPLIVSGLAYGIDIHAHKFALKHNLPTVGIMGSGIDKIYPKLHQKTVSEMVENDGGIMTEYKLGTDANPKNFPARNRIIAGLSDALIVVEAAARGGALITANIADTYNKDIFAIPGNLDSKYSEGCNKLISRHRANIYTDIKNFEEIMGWETDGVSKNMSKKNFSINKENCSEEEIKVLEIMESGSKEMLIDELCWLSHTPVNKIGALLLTLEFKGLVKSLPGKKFKLNII